MRIASAIGPIAAVFFFLLALRIVNGESSQSLGVVIITHNHGRTIGDVFSHWARWAGQGGGAVLVCDGNSTDNTLLALEDARMTAIKTGLIRDDFAVQVETSVPHEHDVQLRNRCILKLYDYFPSVSWIVVTDGQTVLEVPPRFDGTGKFPLFEFRFFPKSTERVSVLGPKGEVKNYVVDKVPRISLSSGHIPMFAMGKRCGYYRPHDPQWVCVDNPNAYILLIEKPYHTALEKAQIEAAIDSDAEIEGPWMPSLDPSYDITVRRLEEQDNNNNVCTAESVRILTKALEADPDDVKLIIGLAEVYECREDFRSASAEYEVALARLNAVAPLKKDDEIDDLWFVSYRLAVTSPSNTVICKEKLLIDAFELRPERREPLNYLAVTAKDRKKPYSALMYATQVKLTHGIFFLFFSFFSFFFRLP